jgi:uncharacterized protein (TIGR02466 family)
MNSIDISTIFPTTIGQVILERDLTQEELDVVHKHKWVNNIGNLVGTNVKILNLPELSEIRKFIEMSVRDYFLILYPDRKDIDIYITLSWLNYTKTNEYHHAHAHSNSFISGVFYIMCDEETDSIEFYSTRYKQIEIGTNEHNIYNSDSWKYQLKKNMLILFPSSLQHSVPQVEKIDHARVSLAFNTFVKGSFGDDKQLTGLTL